MSSLEHHVIASDGKQAIEKLHAGVESLTLHSLAGAVDGMADLAARKELSSVTELTLCGRAPDWRKAPLPVAALATIATAPALTQVKKLHLTDNLLDDQGAIALASASWLSTVEELYIIKNSDLHGDGVFELVRHLPALRKLFIEACFFGDRGAEAIARSDMPLRDLELRGCSIEEAGGRALFGAAFMEGITRFAMSHALLRDALARLAIRPASTLETLQLSRCSLNDVGTAELAKGVSHASLADVDLSNNLLGDDTARAFASCKCMPELERLDLRLNKISPAGAAALCSTEAMPKLALLGLTENELFTGKQRAHEWEGGMWEAGAVTVDERMDADQIVAKFGKRPGLGVF